MAFPPRKARGKPFRKTTGTPVTHQRPQRPEVEVPRVAAGWAFGFHGVFCLGVGLPLSVSLCAAFGSRLCWVFLFEIFGEMIPNLTCTYFSGLCGSTTNIKFH